MQSKEGYFYKGRVYESFPISLANGNRAFRLGDGFFETIRVKNGQIPFWDAHYARISAACKALNIEIPESYSQKLLLDSLHGFLNDCRIDKGAILRISFFREGSGTYKPESNRLAYLAEVKVLSANDFILNDSGMKLGVYRDLKKLTGKFAPYKMLGNQVYIQASIWGQANDFDDVLICNPSDFLIEGSSSNLFLVKDGEIHTPGLNSGCVAGVMRMVIVNAALEMGIPIYESTITEQDLMEANEVFLTNATSGIRWVGSYRDKRYFHNTSDKLLKHVNLKTELVNLS